MVDNARWFIDYYNARWYQFTGVAEGATDGEEWNGMFHPDDRKRAWARWQQSITTGDPYEIEYRLRHRSGDYRWVLGQGLPVRDATGQITRWIGTCTDIDAAKRAAEHNEILSRELSHRIKNIFAVISGLVGLSARRHPEAKTFADDLRARISALGRAHEFVRPHSDESRPIHGKSTLRTMIDELFQAYPARDEGRIRFEGDDVPIDDRGATPVALVFHELATNAVKYGALSTPTGSIVIQIRRYSNNVEIIWHEMGGPPLSEEPAQPGFGTRLIELSIVQQLGGTIDRKWLNEGLRICVDVQTARLMREVDDPDHPV